MRTQDFIIGLMVAMACIITMISFAYFNYQRLGVTVDPQTDNLLIDLNGNASYALGTTKDVTDDIRSKSPGGENTGSSNADQTVENNLVSQGWRAITGIPRSFEAFGKILGVIETNAQIGVWKGIAYAGLTFIICLLLIGAIMRNFTQV